MYLFEFGSIKMEAWGIDYDDEKNYWKNIIQH